MCWFRRLPLALLALVWLVCVARPAVALVRMDDESVDMAIRYGLENQSMGYATLLGPNWVEGPDGLLLNIYTPFMLLATRASKLGLAESPSNEDMAKARRLLVRDIRELTDPAAVPRIKFSVSMLGESPDFAQQTSARIEGYGRGRAVTLKPVREIRQKAASGSTGQLTGKGFEAINAYYFNFGDVASLDEYTLTIQPPTGDSISLKVRNSRIY